MIYDKLENFDRYAALYPEEWAEVKKFFGAGVTPEPGRYDLLPNGRLYVNVQNYSPHLYDDEKLEYHRDYIDIQLLLLGKEDIICASPEGLEEVIPYSEEKDYGMYSGVSLPIIVPEGFCYIVYPEDAHAPGKHLGDPNDYTKIVVKLAL